MTRDRVHDQGGVTDSFRQWPNLIERGCKRDQTESRNSSISRFKADNTRKRSRLPNRATSICAERTERSVRGNCCCRPATGATRHARQVPRIARQLQRGIFGGRTHGELVQVGFSKWNRTRCAQFPNDGRVIGGAITLQDLRRTGARLTHYADDVFDC